MAKHSTHKDYLEYKKPNIQLRNTGHRQKCNNIKYRRCTIAGRIGIDEGPKVVDSRSRIGDIIVD